MVSLPRIPKRTGQTTRILQMRMEISEWFRQWNSGREKMEMAITPMGSAFSGMAPASVMNWETMNLENMLRR